MNYIKDDKGNILKEVDKDSQFIIEKLDGSMIEVIDFREGVAAILGNEYLDCETADTEWHYRLDAAKKIGLAYIATEENTNVIVYDERIGKIPYSYTDPNPDYKIPIPHTLIRIECNDTFLLTLLDLGYIRIWERIGEYPEDFKDYKMNRSIEQIIEGSLEMFHEKIQMIPLYERVTDDKK